jgi:murein DD-endopeptidase MepM/ murein hydrolase activator NlpD
MNEPDKHLSIILVPEEGGDTRTFRVSRRRLRAFRLGGIALGSAAVFMLGSWPFLVARSARVEDLEDQVAQLQAEQARVRTLVLIVDDLEKRYEMLRSLFGYEGSAPAPEIWLPPPGGRRSGSVRAEDGEPIPSTWPLADRGFVTQRLLAGDAGEHPGLDIAVPTDSYILAAGSGVVSDVGDDPTYGRFIRIDHENGYETLYAHTSMTLKELGARVRRSEVIALSGSTGLSTAPHLHFEILLDDELVDPLTMVQQP